jgi:tetratricopeptide (TPR) repeat protein
MISAKKLNNKINQGHWFNLSALYHYYNLDYDSAIRHLNKALVIFKEASDRDDMLESIIYSCINSIEQDSSASVENDLKAAQNLFNDLKCEYLKPLLLLASGMHERVHNPSEAVGVLTKAKDACEISESLEILWMVYRELALAFQKLGNSSMVVKSYKDSINTLKRITEKFENEKHAISYLSVPIRKRVFDEIKQLNR